MKRLILYISTFVAAGALMASCDVNKPDIFDDANAFVAFDKATITVDEDYSADGSVLKVPVTLASVAGIEENVSFRVVEGTAKAGVNYELLTTSGVLSFNAENRTQYIEFDILEDGKFTGDLKFTIEFVNTNSVKQGAENTCVVTIGDIDHPLAAMLGTYEFTGRIAGQSLEDFTETTWEVTVSRDENDVNRVWLKGLHGPEDDFTPYLNFYATVDDGMTTITIPYGQECDVVGQYNIALYGLSEGWTQTEDEIVTGSLATGALVGDIQKSEGKVTGIQWKTKDGLHFYETEYMTWFFVVDAGGITVVKK